MVCQTVTVAGNQSVICVKKSADKLAVMRSLATILTIAIAGKTWAYDSGCMYCTVPLYDRNVAAFINDRTFSYIKELQPTLNLGKVTIPLHRRLDVTTAMALLSTMPPILPSRSAPRKR